uniref:Uncharacterized protein n=2 Tax=Arabidopsis thaliana TaxID=3702 RepID=Q1PEA7_ARATH|nr:hypothetical protein At4g09400 [Arabidopsis thaliana]
MSAPSSPASLTPTSPDCSSPPPPEWLVDIGMIRLELGVPLHRVIPPGAVEPTVPWMRSPLPGYMGPDFVPAPRDFVPSEVIWPEKFFGQTNLFPEMHEACQMFIQKVDNQHQAYRRRHRQLLIKLQDLERGMRRLEAHPKDWVRYGFDKVADIPLPLRRWCVEHDGSSPNYACFAEPIPIKEDDEPDDGSYYRRVDEPPREYPPDSLFQ